MNINNLEKLVRQALKGEGGAEKSNTMLNNQAITPAEHKSFNQMTFQLGGLNAGAGAGTVALLRPNLTWL